MTTSKTVFLSGVVALAVAIAAFFGLPFVAPSAPSAGYSQSNPGEFPEGAKLGTTGSRFYSGTLKASQGQGQASYRNTSGKDQYIDLLGLRTTGTASTTQTLTAGTSTSATFNSFSVPSTVKKFINVALATTSAATTTNSVQGPGAGTGDGSGLVRLADGEYFNFGLYQTYGTACSGSVCEAATSTNRGFDVRYFFRVLQPESY